jgi:hypothetical protein
MLITRNRLINRETYIDVFPSTYLTRQTKYNVLECNEYRAEVLRIFTWYEEVGWDMNFI